jgi:hypothetical protein
LVLVSVLVVSNKAAIKPLDHGLLPWERQRYREIERQGNRETELTIKIQSKAG